MPETHNGLRSVIAETGESGFIRVRTGVGKPQEDLIKHVLSGYAPEDKQKAMEGYEKAAKAVKEIITAGVASAQQKYN